MSSAMKNVNKISQIVRLKQLVSRWKSKSGSDSDETARAPAGCVAVYVGSERRRFVIPTRFLNLPVFVALLDQAHEEFGYPASGGLTLPCEACFFAGILRLLHENEEKFRGLGLHEFLQILPDNRVKNLNF